VGYLVDTESMKTSFKSKVAEAVEAPLHPDQREVELKVLATLAKGHQFGCR
jgi:hypothetical protein